jgi:hypothetical protein
MRRFIREVRSALCLSDSLPKSRHTPTGSGSGIPAISEKELRRSVREMRSASRRYKKVLDGVGKPPQLRPHLKYRKAMLEAQLRGVNKMLKLLPEDPDLRAALCM